MTLSEYLKLKKGDHIFYAHTGTCEILAETVLNTDYLVVLKTNISSDSNKPIDPGVGVYTIPSKYTVENWPISCKREYTNVFYTKLEAREYLMNYYKLKRDQAWFDCKQYSKVYGRMKEVYDELATEKGNKFIKLF